MATPAVKAVNTTSTSGVRHCVPKKKCTVASCWLFSAKANRVKKMAALSIHLSSHKSFFMSLPGDGSILALRPAG